MTKTDKENLGSNEFTLTSFSTDTTSLQIEKALPSGGYRMYYFKYIPTSIMNQKTKIKATYIELNANENRNYPNPSSDSAQAINYHGYSFEIDMKDWIKIKQRVKDIEVIADTIKAKSFCEFCTEYFLSYNDKIISNQSGITPYLERFFSELEVKYFKLLKDSHR